MVPVKSQDDGSLSVGTAFLSFVVGSLSFFMNKISNPMTFSTLETADALEF